MHAVLITFRPEATEEELMASVGPKMKNLATTPGLIMKTFVEAGPQRWGGFYLFTNKEAADAYLEGEFFQWFSKNPLLSNIDAQHFNVDDEPSKGFGTPSVPLADAHAA